jgi:hypothetical protein
MACYTIKCDIGGLKLRKLLSRNFNTATANCMLTVRGVTLPKISSILAHEAKLYKL